MDDKDRIKRIEDAEKRLYDYYQKLDDDFKLWDLEETKYEVHATAINVTSNEPRLFANEVQTDLSSAEMQIAVKCPEGEKEEEREKEGKLERLFDFLFYQADERLEAILLPPLKRTLIWLFGIRGMAGARILNYIEDGKIVPDYTGVDPRWLTYGVGSKGFSWVSNKQFKSKDQLDEEWGHIPKAPFFWRKEKETYAVDDYWEIIKGSVSNTIFCNKEAIHKETYKNLKSLPFLLMPVTDRMPVVTPDNTGKGRYGESIYAGKREMYKLENQLMTNWATHAKIISKQPLLNYIDDESLRLDSTILYAEGILNLAKGKQEIVASPLREVSPTLVSLVNWTEDKIERGQTPRIAMTSPPASGTMANIYREAGNRIYNPQVQVLSRFYASMCRMIEEQLKAGGVGGEKIKKIKVETEREGKYWTYDMSPIDLQQPHTIKVEMTVKTPWSQMDIAQQADMLKRLGLPYRWIWEFILKVPDPKLLEELAVLEMAEHSPMLAMKKAVDVLEKYGKTLEAKALAAEIVRMEAQEAGEGAPPEPMGTEPVPLAGSMGEPISGRPPGPEEVMM